MKLKINLLLISIVLLCSFTSGKKSPAGIYNSGNDSHHFEIRKDSTYLYKYVIDTFIDIVSEGRWKVKDAKTILLTSYKEYIPLSLEVEKRPTPGSKRVRQLHINLISDKGNEEEFFVTPISNRAVFPNYIRNRGSYMLETAFLIDSVSFQIHKEPEENSRPKPTKYYHKISQPPKYTDLRTEQVQLKLSPGESAYITIRVKDEDFKYRTFSNTPLQIDGKGATFKDSDDNRMYNLKREKE